MKEITVPATVEELDTVLAFVEGELEAIDCPIKAQTQLMIAVEEIYVNIAHYAYHPEDGNATVKLSIDDDGKISIQFIDQGRPYDPTEKKDPDVTLSAEERDIGGLGIYIVKKSMDSVNYEYKDGKNILTIKKNII